MSSPAVAVYSQSLNVRVVDEGQRVVSVSTTTTDVTVVFQYVHTGKVVVAVTVLVGGTLVVELVVLTASDCAMAPAARRPAMANEFILEYMLCKWMMPSLMTAFNSLEKI
jgi:translation elongation factor EF-Ts